MQPSKNGCHNRPPLGERTHPVQTGWVMVQDDDIGILTRSPIMVNQASDRMTTDCQYSRSTRDDPGCAGCKWKYVP